MFNIFQYEESSWMFNASTQTISLSISHECWTMINNTCILIIFCLHHWPSGKSRGKVNQCPPAHGQQCSGSWSLPWTKDMSGGSACQKMMKLYEAIKLWEASEENMKRIWKNLRSLTSVEAQYSSNNHDLTQKLQSKVYPDHNCPDFLSICMYIICIYDMRFITLSP